MRSLHFTPANVVAQVRTVLSMLEGGPAGGQHDAQATSPSAARPRALAVLRLLCQASARLARNLTDAGAPPAL